MLAGAAESVDGSAVLHCNIQHIVSRVPASLHVARDEAVWEVLLLQDVAPRGQDDRSRMDYFERKTPDLSTV